MKYFLDTNIFLRYFTDENSSKVLEDCKKLFEKIKKGEFKAVTSNLVLAEIVWTLSTSYNATKTQVIKVLKSITAYSNLKIIDGFDTNMANNYFEQKSIKYIDALIASNPDIQSGKMTVISYDKDFDKLKVKRLEPDELVK